MQGIGDVWDMAAEKWETTMAQIGDDDWGKTTPCDDWTVQELVDHAMMWQGRGGAAFGADAEADWATLRPALSGALHDPASMEGVVESFGNMSKPAIAGLLTADLLVHAWDLATAIGADASLPEAAAESTLMGLQRLPAEMLRNPNMFGAEVEVADDASAQDRLIGFVGRQP